jgi:pimeloyl-ACP methyl ester carboxylesterase
MAEEIVEKKKAPFSWVRVFSVTGAVLLVLLVVAVWRVQPKLAFNPAPKLIATPAIYDLKFEDVRVEKNGLSVAGWLVHTDKESRGTVLFCHSSSGNRSYELDTALFFTKAGFDVLLFDYPGFADSSGVLSERNCYRSAELMLNYLEAQNLRVPLLVYGRARGAAVATQLAAKRSPDMLMLEGAYPSWPEQASDQMGAARHLILWRFPTFEFLQKVTVPVLFVHSAYDREVPMELGRRVYAAYQGPKEFFETGGLHGEAMTVCAPAYQEALLAFLKGVEVGGRGECGSVGVVE